MLGEKGTNKERGKSYNEVFCVGLEFKASVWSYGLLNIYTDGLYQNKYRQLFMCEYITWKDNHSKILLDVRDQWIIKVENDIKVIN
jgi:hypothetical protein